MDARVCRGCGVILTFANRFTCSLKYKCKFGKCSNKYTCRRNDLCIKCQRGDIKTGDVDHFADAIQEAMEEAASHAASAVALDASVFPPTCVPSSSLPAQTAAPEVAPVNRKRAHDDMDHYDRNAKMPALNQPPNTGAARASDGTTSPPLVPSKRVSVADLFHLSDHADHLDGIFAGADTSRRWAWLGDSIVEAYVSHQVYQSCSTGHIGDLTLHKARYVCNSTMATFLQLATDAPERMKVGLSQHSQGTVFEALLGATALLDSRDRAERVVRKYMDYVDACAEKFSFPIGATPPLAVWTYARDPEATTGTTSATAPGSTSAGLELTVAASTATTQINAAVNSATPTINDVASGSTLAPDNSAAVGTTSTGASEALQEPSTPPPSTGDPQYTQVLSTMYGSVSRSSREFATTPLAEVVRDIPEYHATIMSPLTASPATAVRGALAAPTTAQI